MGRPDDLAAVQVRDQYADDVGIDQAAALRFPFLGVVVQLAVRAEERQSTIHAPHLAPAVFTQPKRVSTTATMSCHIALW